MPKASVKRLIKCQKKDLINLVLDIEKYPQFVPFCYDAKIYESKDEGDLKKINKKVFTKSGLMVGLGEIKDELVQVMDDLRSADVDFLTIGQYLQPSAKHHPLERYYHPDEFKDLENIAKSKGFLLVSSSPLTRSSYHADEDFAQLQKNRLEKFNAQSLS